MAAGEKPERGSVALPTDLLEKIQQFVATGEAKDREYWEAWEAEDEQQAGAQLAQE